MAKPTRGMSPVYWIGYTFFKGVARFLFDYKVVGAERLIERGPALIASNHVSFLDPPLVGIGFRNAIHYLARRTLFKGPMDWVYRQCNSIPVDQERADFTSLKTIIRLLKQEQRVLIFPEGQRTTDGNLMRGAPGVGLVIAKAGVPVLPVRLFGTFEALPRGASWPRVVKVTLVVGTPIDLSEEKPGEGGAKELYQRLSDRVMDEIGKLELPADRAPYRS